MCGLSRRAFPEPEGVPADALGPVATAGELYTRPSRHQKGTKPRRVESAPTRQRPLADGFRLSRRMGGVDPNQPGEAVTEAGWAEIRADGRVRTELLDAAYVEPRLRQLFPWAGMGELHFSRCTGFRWTWDIPYIQPAVGGGYWVSGPSRKETVGPAATSEQAIAMVVERLPPGCGPAFVGSPEELSSHEATARNQATGEG
ncbi:hypothetical protein GCM10009544_57250 [Streptomyces stramineus]|uniref:Uncharacterized protein n=2 Tax=Streptomyces stramineus TaxID=173861 RepID=A0ABP3L0T1_9ACTN